MKRYSTPTTDCDTLIKSFSSKSVSALDLFHICSLNLNFDSQTLVNVVLFEFREEFEIGVFCAALCFLD